LVIGHREGNLAALRAQALELALTRWPDLLPRDAQARGAILFSLVRGSTRDAARKAARIKPDLWQRWLRDPAWLEDVESAEGEAINIAADRLHSASENPAYWFSAVRWLERRTQEFAPKTEVNINQRFEGEFNIASVFKDATNAAKVIEQISFIEGELQGREALATALPAHLEAGEETGS
jgi:hypothetical protein